MRFTASSISAGLIAKIFWVWAACAFVLLLIVLSAQAIGLIVIAAFFALALGPPVDFFNHKARMPRALAILFVYLLTAFVLVLLGLIVIPPIASGIQDLIDDLPQKIEDLKNTGWIRDLNDRYDVVDKLRDAVKDLDSNLIKNATGVGGSVAGTVRDVTVGAFSAMVQTLTVLTMIFLMLLQGPRVVDWAIQQFPNERGRRIARISDSIYRVVSGYVIGNLLISLCAGLMTYLVLTILGVPFAAPLAILMAFLDLIPLVGASLGGLMVACVTAAFGDFPTDVLIWGVVLIAYQQVENNFLQPIIYRRTVAVPPLLVIVSVLIGAALLGVVGVLMAIPIAAIIQVIVKDLWLNHTNPPPLEGAGLEPLLGPEEAPAEA